MHPLDRPVWNALTSRQAHLALGEKERFLRFPADIEPFGATRDNSPEQLAGLAELTPLDGHVALAEVATLPAPPGFISMILAAIHQMTAPKIGPPDDDLEVLSLSDPMRPKCALWPNSPSPALFMPAPISWAALSGCATMAA